LTSLIKGFISYKYYIYYSIKKRKSKFYRNMKNGLNFKNQIQYNAVSVPRPEDKFLGESE